MVKKVIITVAVLAFVACSNKDKTAKETDLVFDKLVGTWKLTDEDQFERWSKTEDGNYSSRTFAIGGKDTSEMEDVKIVKDAGKWNFVTIVKGQNKGKAVTFTSTIIKDSLIQFENPAHDFPRIISYRLVSENTLQAFIAGTTDTIYFNYSRVIGK